MAVTIKKSSTVGALSITPLIDVVFLLLIFFLVATRFEKVERDLSVPLPKASEAKPHIEQPQDIFVNIDRAGRCIVNGRVMSVAEVKDVLAQAVSSNPLNQIVIIRADRNVSFQYPVAVMDICEEIGAVYKIATDEEGAGAAR